VFLKQNNPKHEESAGNRFHFHGRNVQQDLHFNTEDEPTTFPRKHRESKSQWHGVMFQKTAPPRYTATRT